MSTWFDRFTAAASRWLAHPAAFLLMLGSVLAWLFRNGMPGFIDGLTCIGTLMAFVILADGQRGSAAMQAKQDATIRALPDASNDLVGLDERPIAEIEAVRVTLHEVDAPHNKEPPCPA